MRVEPLIERRYLLRDSFGKLLRSYREAKKWADIERVIAFVVSAHGNESIETRFFLCHVALESLVNSIVRRHPEWTPKPDSLPAKILACVNHYRVPVVDLWKKNPFEKGLNSALSGRNRLFHGASVDTFGVLHGNLIKLGTLTERLLIAILHWPPDKLWPHRDQELRMLLE